MNEVERILKEIQGITKKGLNNLLITPLNDGLESFSRRIFTEGQGVKGKKYSRKPYYQSVSKESFDKKYKTESGSQISNNGFKPRGKFSKDSKFKNGKNRKTMYLEKGYKEFRERAGRSKNGDKINFDLTGELKKSIQTGIQGDSAVIGIVGQENADKARGNEQHFKQEIFVLNEDDIDVIEKSFLKELDRFLNF